MKSRKSSLVTILKPLIALMLLVACDEKKPTPKPRGYFRISLPEQAYEASPDSCPYQFQMNQSARWIKKRGGVCWADIKYPSLDATVQLTYKDLDRNNLDSLIADGHRMAYKHTVAADAIDEKLYTNRGQRVYGLLYKMQGDAASNAQFFMTDSTNHFLRGVLYFYAEPNADSLKPAADFMYSEIVHLIETLEWQNS